MGEEREELIHEVRDRRGRQTGETGVLTGNSGSKLGSRGGGRHGMGVGDTGERSKGGTWDYSGITQGSMDDMPQDQGTRGRCEEGIR